jgi:hypothetical protein
MATKLVSGLKFLSVDERGPSFGPTIHAQTNSEKSETVFAGIHSADVSRPSFSFGEHPEVIAYDR